MPLVAYDQNGERVVSLDYSPSQWDELTSQVRGGEIALTMPCCGVRAWPRISPGELFHFYHLPERHDNNKKPCHAPSESPEHLKLKGQVVVALREMGWDAQPEVSGNGWRADVLARKGSSQLIVEIQLSYQTASQTRQRQDAYLRDGIPCVWLMKKLPKGLQLSDDMTAFQIRNNGDKQWMVSLGELAGQNELAINDFLSLLTQGRIKNRTFQPGQIHVHAHQWFADCWKCKQSTPVVFAAGSIECDCGYNLRPIDSSSDFIGAALAQKLDSMAFASSAIFQFRSSRELERKTWRSHCVHCGIPQANRFLARDFKTKYEKLGEILLPIDDSAGLAGWWNECEELHWCTQPTEELSTIASEDTEAQQEQLALEF